MAGAKVTFQQELLKHKKLSEICTLGAGGEAEFFTQPKNPEDFKNIFTYANEKNIPLYIIGGGSNILFPDGLVKGIFLSTRKLNSIEWLSDFKLKVHAGYMLSNLLNEISKRNSGGLEFAYGIPGTVGGAIYGNAGTSGQGICDLINEVCTLESNGTFKIWNKNDFDYSYRYCGLSDDSNRIIISCVMTFRESKIDDKQKIQELISKRKNQPISFRSAGCTFKNPVTQTNKSAGQLLDECGCKGLKVGGAVVSDRHANFILNINGASGNDILKLIKLCRERVFENTGVKLETEIKFVGFDKDFITDFMMLPYKSESKLCTSD